MRATKEGSARIKGIKGRGDGDNRPIIYRRCPLTKCLSVSLAVLDAQCGYWQLTSPLWRPGRGRYRPRAL